VIRPEFEPLADRAPDSPERDDARPATRARAKPSPAKTAERQAFPPAPIPAWARASGRAGEGDPLFAAGAALALLDGHLRTDPPAAGALRVRLALKSATASAKMLSVNTDEGALRDLRFAVGDPLGPAANLLSHWRDCAGRPPSLDPDRIGDAAARLDLGLANTTALTESLLAHSRAGNPVSAAAKAAATVFSHFPDAPAAPPEILALWAFDMVIAIRLRWPRPLPLIATKILDPTLRSQGGVRRPRPATQPGQPPPQARSRSPPPPPSTSPPILTAAPRP
jgi:hypothetical protein